jgi:hypothetical protein
MGSIANAAIQTQMITSCRLANRSSTGDGIAPEEAAPSTAAAVSLLRDEHGDPDLNRSTAVSPTRHQSIQVAAKLPSDKKRRGSGVSCTTIWSHWRKKLRSMDPIKWAYLRTSFVFAVSVLITWTPSSINRMYDLAIPGQANFGLSLASAIVLPLQGVWNAIIFFSMSWSVLKEEVRKVRCGDSLGMPEGGATATSIRLERFRDEQRQQRRKNERPKSSSATEMTDAEELTSWEHERGREDRSLCGE